MEWIARVSQRFKVALGLAMGILLVSLAGSLIGELKTIVSIISWPIVYFSTTLHPTNDTPDFFKILYSSVCIMIYIAFISFPFLSIASKDKQLMGTPPQIDLYTEEISATMEVIERHQVSDLEIEQAVEDLMRTIGSQIVGSFPSINPRNVRYSFLVADPNTNDILTVRLGRHLRFTDDDHFLLGWMFTNISEDRYLSGDVKTIRPSSDMEAVGLVRNVGSTFRFGFVIFLPSATVIAEETQARFNAASSLIQHIAYMDKLYNLMILYSKSN